MRRSFEHSVVADDEPSQWATWDAFVRHTASGTVYHTSAWLLPLIREMGQDICVHVVTESGQIRAGAVVRRARRSGIVIGRKPWATAYSGPVHDHRESSESVNALLQNLKRTYHHVRLVTTPEPDGTLEIPKTWSVQDDNTPMLDIHDIQSLWHRFDRHARQRVRKAQDAGIVIAEIESASAFYHLYKLTYGRQDMPMPLTESEVSRVLESARAKGAARLFLARTRDNEPAAALAVLADSKRAYFTLAGSHPELRKTDAVTLLWWHTIQEYSATHYELDLVGLGTPSIAHFKQSFSPTLRPFLDLSCYSSALMKSAFALAGASKQYARRLTGR